MNIALSPDPISVSRETKTNTASSEVSVSEASLLFYGSHAASRSMERLRHAEAALDTPTSRELVEICDTSSILPVSESPRRCRSQERAPVEVSGGLNLFSSLDNSVIRTPILGTPRSTGSQVLKILKLRGW